MSQSTSTTLQRLHLWSLTRESANDSFNKLITTGNNLLTTLLRVPMLTKVLLNNLKLLMASLISSWCHILSLKVVSNRLISTLLKTLQTSARWPSWTSLTLCAITTTTGMMQLRHQPHACLQIRLLVSGQKSAQSRPTLSSTSYLSISEEWKDDSKITINRTSFLKILKIMINY